MDRTIKVKIEIPLNSKVKYEFNHDSNCLEIDRVLPPNVGGYPANYGFVPETLCEDGDPLDAFVLSDQEFVPGSVVKATVLGLIRMQDNDTSDPKLIVKLHNDPEISERVLNLIDIPKIVSFLNTYKTGVVIKSTTTNLEECWNELAKAKFSYYSNS